jgi:hypothetical protein
MQEAQRKTEQKARQKSKATSSEAFAVEQAEMSEFSDASDNIKEMPEMQEFLDDMETEVCNHYVTLKNLKHDLTLLIIQF